MDQRVRGLAIQSPWDFQFHEMPWLEIGKESGSKQMRFMVLPVPGRWRGTLEVRHRGQAAGCQEKINKEILQSGGCGRRLTVQCVEGVALCGSALTTPRCLRPPNDRTGLHFHKPL